MRPPIHYAHHRRRTERSRCATGATPAPAGSLGFGPDNPFYAPSTLPFQAPPFDKIQDSDYQPAIEAGMAQQLTEIRAIADNPDLPLSRTPSSRSRKAAACWIG